MEIVALSGVQGADHLPLNDFGVLCSLREEMFTLRGQCHGQSPPSGGFGCSLHKSSIVKAAQKGVHRLPGDECAAREFRVRRAWCPAQELQAGVLGSGEPERAECLVQAGSQHRLSLLESVSDHRFQGHYILLHVSILT